MAAQSLFFVAVALMAYVYAGYAVLMRTGARYFSRPVAKSPITPTVTIIVAAFNEERSIVAKLDNLTALNYPTEKLDVIVASDGSTDNTDHLVAEYGKSNVKVLRVEGRVGKTACQNAAVEAATGEIVLFTDATTTIDQDAIAAIVRNFSDKDVGCVAAKLVYVGKNENLTAAGGTAYWSYEIALRSAESALGSLIGVSGCLYAVRRTAYRPIRADLISDFVVAMIMREQNLRTVLELDAVCFEETLDRSAQEVPMRVRVAIRSIAALVSERRLLNPFRYGLFSIELISHKALRYASPFIWLVALVCAALLMRRPFFLACLIAQLVLIAAGLAGFALQLRGQGLGMLGKPYYFLLTNYASGLAVVRYLRGERVRIWNPVRT